LKLRGIAHEVVAVGSTPTCSCPPSHLNGITEMHPGNYIFYDYCQHEIGSCDQSEIAVRVASRVIGSYPDRNQLLLDVGSLALSKDVGADHLATRHSKTTFGLIIGHPELQILSLSQEVAKVVSEKPINFTEFPIGKMIYIFPNHSCLTAALFPQYYVVDGNDTIIDIWIPNRGW